MRALHFSRLMGAVIVAAAAMVLVLALACAPAQAQAAGFGPPAAAQPYRATLLRAAHSQWGLHAPVAMLAAQVQQESGWNPQAVSRAGAVGMAQFMPATARWWCGGNSTTPAALPTDCQPTNPTWALRALVGYDKWLYDRLQAAGAEPERLWATLRAYNGGLGHWRAEAQHAASLARADVDSACGSARRALVHCAENLGYPRRIMLGLQPRYATWGRAVGVNA